MVAITTSKGNLHKYIIDLRQEDLTWVQIKKKLFERFSECGSSTIAKHRLAKLKQEDLAMHTYIAEFTNDTLTYVCQEFNIKQTFTSPYTPRSNGKTENFNKFLKASIRKLCQEDTATWDQVCDQILFAYRCYPHTSTGEAPYTLLYGRDPPLPIQKLINTNLVESYKGDNPLGKRIEESRITLSIAAKMMERMRANQKRHYLHRRSTHKFQVEH